jgi:putative transposase
LLQLIYIEQSFLIDARQRLKVESAKGKSSYFIRKEYWDHVKTMLWGKHFWSPSYCIVSCGGSSLDQVKAYIKKQKEPPSSTAIKRSIALNKKN